MDDHVAEIDDDGIDYDNYGMDFCQGLPMTMSMKGFQSAFLNSNNNTTADCLTFLFTNWKLDKSGKFVEAMRE